MRKISIVLVAFMIAALFVQPAQAADVEFRVKFSGSSESFEGAKVSLAGRNETFVQPLAADGTALFKVPAGTYGFSLNSNSAPALSGFSLVQQEVVAPGEANLKVPTSRITEVRFVLPDGSLLPGIGPVDGQYARVQSGDGFTWGGPIATPVSSIRGVNKYKVFVAAESRGSLDPIYDADGDGYSDLTLTQSTANGGYKRLVLPSSLFIRGGDFAISDASYLKNDQPEIRAANGSMFTVTFKALNFGKGVTGLSSRLYQLNSNNLLSALSYTVGAQLIAQQPIKADGTVSFSFVVRTSTKFISASQNGAQYALPAETIPVYVATAKSTYKNCATLNQDFQGGVSNSGAKNKGVAAKFKPTFNDKLYKAVKKLDVDNDGIACEK